MKKAINFGLMAASTLLASVPAMAEEAAAGGTKSAMAAAIAIGMAVVGGAIGQGYAASSALDGIARNPAAQGKIFIPMIIGLALIESLVIYALIIAMKVS